MKKVFGIGLVAVALIASLASWKSKNIYEGYINWKAGNKFYKAEGSFANWEVQNLKYEKGAIEDLTLDIVVDINSVEEKSDKLVHHLKEDDYFNVALFPKATVHVSNITKTDTSYMAQFITTIKSISDTTTGHFKVLSEDPLKVEGYAFINRPKHLIGLPLKKSSGITEMVRVDFMLNLEQQDE